MISFKGHRFPKHATLHVVNFYLRKSVPLRDLKQILVEHGSVVDYATPSRWVVKSPIVTVEAHKGKNPCAVSWRMEETNLKLHGKWKYLYRTVVREGKTLDFMLSECRDIGAEKQFFAKAFSNSSIPLRIAIDRSGANAVGI